jgi:hypothetical protein
VCKFFSPSVSYSTSILIPNMSLYLRSDYLLAADSLKWAVGHAIKNIKLSMCAMPIFSCRILFYRFEIIYVSPYYIYSVHSSLPILFINSNLVTVHTKLTLDGCWISVYIYSRIIYHFKICAFGMACLPFLIYVCLHRYEFDRSPIFI